MPQNRNSLYSQLRPACDGTMHTIMRGDSLYKLAMEHNITVEDILEINPDLNPYNLQIGMRICIPSNNRMRMR